MTSFYPNPAGPSATPPSSFHTSAPASFFATGRKRRAASPPASTQSPTPSWDHTPIAAKRRRPNLANGFSGLSLNSSSTNLHGPSSLPTYTESQQLDDSRKVIDDDDIFADPALGETGYDRNDVSVEEVHSRPRRPFPVRCDSSSTSGYSSDATSTIAPLRRRTTRQADEVELPPEHQYVTDGVSIEDVTPQNRRKRRSESVEREGPIKRSRDEMDVDMGDIEEIPRKRSEWFEPEKDRIVYTSLSSSSRSSSPEAEPAIQLSQPGDNGFTISPSMLTRLLATKTSIPPPFPHQREMGLVLYRPLGIPQTQRDVQNIVREWQGRVDDVGRFESVDDDEDLTLVEGAQEGGMDVD